MPARATDSDILSSVAQLSNEDLLAQVRRLAERERDATVSLIAHLAVLDARRLYLAEGYSSLFVYCTQALQLSEHAAYGRIAAARAARRFPVVLKMLLDGSINLTTVCLLGPHLTPENHQGLLDEVQHKRKRDVEEFIARLHPRPSVPSSIRRVPTPGQQPMASVGRHSVTNPETSILAPEGAVPSSHAGDARSAPTSHPAPQAPDARAASITPLAPHRYRVQFTASAETVNKLRLAQALLRHQIPTGDLAELLDRALTALLDTVGKRKTAQARSPRHGRAPAPKSRHIPADVKRAVWLRDGGQCAFVGASGRRCSELGFLEFHHVLPYSAGGDATVQNIQLRCRAHNGFEAVKYPGTQTPAREPAMVREGPRVYTPARNRARGSLRKRTARTRSGPSTRPDGEPP